MSQYTLKNSTHDLMDIRIRARTVIVVVVEVVDLIVVVVVVVAANR